MALIQYLIDGVFARQTPWEFTTSRGISGSALVFGGGVGSLYLNKKSGSEQEPDRELDYAIIGASLGPAPVGLSFSTKDFFSAGIGHVRSRTDSDLTFDDMTGVICTVGLSGTALAGVPYGMSVVMYFMGLPWYYATLDLMTVNFAGLVAHGLTKARAMGIMVGRFTGFDAGLGVQLGYAR